MKLLLVVLFASVAWAQRPLTVAVIDKMYQVYPMYRQIQDYVINQVADARMASSARIDEFHRDIIMIKSNYLATSIRQEQDLITQINGQPLSVNQQCLSFLRQSAEVNMNLAGVSYSTCITNAGDSLVTTVKAFYELLDTDEARYVGVGLFEEFRDENVFFDPQRIISKLENRVFRLEDYPTHIGSEVLDAVAGLSNMLENIRLNYINCMTLGEQMLRSALQLGLLQLEQTCNGNLIPVAEEAPVPPNVGHREVTASPGQNRLTTDDAMYGDDRAGPSNPQKRGVNPLLYREAELRNDFSGNSIPQNGVWEDVDVPLPGMPYPLELFDAPIEPGPFDRFNQQQQQQRTYDVLQNLLSRQPSPYNPLFIGRPVSGGYPVRMHGSGGAYGTERKKRTLATGPAKSYSHQMRLKRSTGKLSPAEVFSLLALMDSRDPYRPLSPLPEYIPDDQTNDVLAYAPNGMYPDVALPLALEQLLGARGGGGAGGDGYAYDDAGEWMNGWTEPSVDYMGIPMADLDALGVLNDGKTGISRKTDDTT
uniref:Uncharacterized protein n=1 Tax=Anopheles coluzzii TaxID=1518534 RepID=A0A8W7PFP8_ANOCL